MFSQLCFIILLLYYILLKGLEQYLKLFINSECSTIQRKTQAAVIKNWKNFVRWRYNFTAWDMFLCLFLTITVGCCFSVPLENIRKPLGFLMFSEGIEKPHRAVM